MISKHHRLTKGAFELIEEAVHLLKLSPVGTLLIYYAGSLPFVLGFLYFWSDMSQNAYAQNHCSVAAFGLTILFIWMKAMQSEFCYRIQFSLIYHSVPAWNSKRFLQTGYRQTIIQSTGLIILPVSLIFTIPFAWTYAFYQMVTAFDTEGRTFRQSVDSAWQQAKLDPVQNHSLISILFLFGIFVFLNIASGIMVFPFLIKMLLGIDTVFTLSSDAFLNTTFLSAAAGISYLCLDPLMKTVYTLRRYYGLSLHTGEDILAELKKLRQNRMVQGIALMMLVSAGMFSTIEAGQTMECEKPALRIDPNELDAAINDVLKKSEFAWRLPRDLSNDAKPPGLFDSFIDWLWEHTETVLKTIKDAFLSVRDWLQDVLPDTGKPIGHKPDHWRESVMKYMDIASAVLFCLAVVMLWRIVLKRTVKKTTAAVELLERAGSDMSSEGTYPGDFPADRWFLSARELFNSRSLKLAIRAFYIGTIALLGEYKILTIAKYKSNHEYAKELKRRVSQIPEISAVFSGMTDLFEKVWYGGYDAGLEDTKRIHLLSEKMVDLVKTN